MTVLSLPDPSVVVLIGPAGSGKSTLAARLFAPEEILSSDTFRAMIAGDERDQRASGPAFRALGRALDRRLAAGRLGIVDATGLTRADRRPWLAAARRHGVQAVAIVLDLPPAVVQARNAGRGRVVDRAVVARHLALVRHTVDHGELVHEGYAEVVTLRTPDEVRDLTVTRRGG